MVYILIILIYLIGDYFRYKKKEEEIINIGKVAQNILNLYNEKLEQNKKIVNRLCCIDKE